MEAKFAALHREILKSWPLSACQSPCDAPILPVIKLNGDYRTVQDLRAINEEGSPCTPWLIRNSMSVQSPGDAGWFTVRDPNDGFVCVISSVCLQVD